MVETQKKLTCPKCKAEMLHIRYGDIDFEECQSCKGLFLDFHETQSDPLAKIRVHSAKPMDPKLAEDLDRMVINCLKCNVKMEKKKDADKGYTLDVCPSCHGVWFDQGEFVKHRGILTKLLRTPSPFKMWYECEPCKTTLDQKQTSLKKGSPPCPRCNKPMKFNSIRIGLYCWRRDLKGILLYASPSIVLFVILLAVLQSVFQALFITLLGSFLIWAFIGFAKKLGFIE